MRRFLLVVACLLTLSAPAGAAVPRFTMSEVEQEVMCPVCGTRLDLSHSPAANEIRTFVAERRADGWTKQQVEDALVAQFGPSIMAATPTAGAGLIAWLVPAFAVVGGIAVVSIAVLAWRRRDGVVRGATAAAVVLDPDQQELVDRAIAEYER